MTSGVQVRQTCDVEDTYYIYVFFFCLACGSGIQVQLFSCVKPPLSNRPKTSNVFNNFYIEPGFDTCIQPYNILSKRLGVNSFHLTQILVKAVVSNTGVSI